MKFSLPKADALRLLNLSSRSMVSRSSLPILSNVLIKASQGNVEAITTSLETAVKVSAKCKVEREGETTVLGRALVEFVGQLSEGDVLFEKLGEEVVVVCGGLSARFATISPDEFPAIPKVDGGKVFKFDATELSKSVSRVFFCAALDESRPILAGVLFDCSKSGVSLVATDGFRLGGTEIMDSKNDAGGARFIVPVRAVSELPKIVQDMEDSKFKHIEMIVADNLSQAVFKASNFEFTTRLIEGAYPQWEKLIPSSFSTKVVLNKEELLRSIKVAAIFAKDAGNIIKMKVVADGKNAGVVVSSNTAQIGSSDSTVSAEVGGPGGEIAFNYRYVLEALSSISGESVVFEMNESLNPGKLTDKDDGSFFHIIMPVRLQAA